MVSAGEARENIRRGTKKKKHHGLELFCKRSKEKEDALTNNSAFFPDAEPLSDCCEGVLAVE